MQNYMLISEWVGAITRYPETLSDSVTECEQKAESIKGLGNFFIVDTKKHKRVKRIER